MEFQYFLNFHNEHVLDKLEPYRTEWEIYDKEYQIAGSIDMIFKKDNKFIIFDWKRCKEIKESNSFEHAFPPIEHLPNCNKWQYALQLNTYKFILEKNYGIEIEQLFLLCIHPDNPSYSIIEIPNMQDEIKLLLDNFCVKQGKKNVKY